MRLKELLHKAGLAQVADGMVDEEILGLTTDSRAVKPGDLFIGLPGTKVDGGEFWPQAVSQGARALVLSEGIKAESSLPTVHDSDISALCGRLASAFYDFPAQKLALAGVTGTNGKTTTTYLLEHLLNSSGHKSALLGTLVARWPGFSQVAQHTTPFSVDIQKTLAQAVEAGCTHGVMEVSSHALAQKRVYPLTFKTAVFTNLTQDHLDYHPTMEDYFQAKALLFVDHVSLALSAHRLFEPPCESRHRRSSKRSLRWIRWDVAGLFAGGSRHRGNLQRMLGRCRNGPSDWYQGRLPEALV